MSSKANTATPRRRLDRQRVIEAAEGLIDRDGPSSLTMSGLARELGVKVPSLYNHVSNLESLVGDLQVRSMRQLATELRSAAMGTVGADALRKLAMVLHGYARRNPGRYALATSAPFDRDAFDEASTDAAEAFTAVIRSFGVDNPTLELMLSAFAIIHGVLALEQAGMFGDVVDIDHVFERAVELVILQIETEASPGAQPRPR